MSLFSLLLRGLLVLCLVLPGDGECARAASAAEHSTESAAVASMLLADDHADLPCHGGNPPSAGDHLGIQHGGDPGSALSDCDSYCSCGCRNVAAVLPSVWHSHLNSPMPAPPAQHDTAFPATQRLPLLRPPIT